MIRIITGTVASRVLVTLFNFLTIALAAQVLGKEGVGIISLVLLGITIIMLMNDLVGGAAIVYLVPRIGVQSLLLPGYVWALCTALVFFGVVHFVELVPERFSFHVLVLAFLRSIFGLHFNIMLARQKIRSYNLITVGQGAVLLAVFYYLLQWMGNIDPKSYVWALYAAYGFSLLASIVGVLNCFGSEQKVRGVEAMRQVLAYGGFTQMANVLQQLNYRLSYYIIEFFSGLGTLGVFSVGTQLSEGAWITPKSMSMVLFMRVSNSDDKAKNSALTIAFVKLATFITALFMLLLILLPESVYTFVFGPEIVGLQQIMLVLTPGILAMAASNMYSHYFSGTGVPKHNTIGSGIGLIATLVAGFTLIPSFGILGAAATASISYTVLTFYKWVVFMRIADAGMMAFLPSASDVIVLKEEWRKFRSK